MKSAKMNFLTLRISKISSSSMKNRHMHVLSIPTKILGEVNKTILRSHHTDDCSIPQNSHSCLSLESFIQINRVSQGASVKGPKSMAAGRRWALLRYASVKTDRRKFWLFGCSLHKRWHVTSYLRQFEVRVLPDQNQTKETNSKAVGETSRMKCGASKAGVAECLQRMLELWASSRNYT